MAELYKQIVNQLVKREMIGEDESIIYQLGFDVLITFSLQSLCILFVGWMSGDIKFAIWYIICFCSIREYSGGYHAGTRIGCTAIMVGIFYTIFKLSVCYERIFSDSSVDILLFALSCIVFALYAPMKTNRKKIKEQTMHQAKTITLFLVITYGIVTLLFFDRNIFVFTSLIETAIAALIIICIRRTRICVMLLTKIGIIEWVEVFRLGIEDGHRQLHLLLQRIVI